MIKNSKQLSPPFSSGNGGAHFEAHVQASFVTLMLTGGFAPCMPSWPIKEIKLQGKIDGYDIDDLIIFVEDPSNGQQRKLLGQIKYTIDITSGNQIFGEVIQAAWNDFNDSTKFTKNKDIIALITGPLSVKDTRDVLWLLRQARCTKNNNEFFRNVEAKQFSSESKRDKLYVFRTQLNKANNHSEISNEELYSFLNHFHLIGYDLGDDGGVVLSLLHSHISQFNMDYPSWAWGRIIDTVQTWNQSAGTIVIEKLPNDLKDTFKQKSVYNVIPDNLSAGLLTSDKLDWNKHTHASTLAIANLIGSWNEKNTEDLKVICQLANENYGTWIKRIREILQQPESPVTLKNGIWYVTERKMLWDALGTRFFDEHLDKFKQCIITVLTERDPQFDLPINERYVALMYDKKLKYSPELRKGMVESLALLGSRPDNLTNCSKKEPENSAVFAISNIFKDADWILWGSLSDLLPVLAEVAPNEFLNVVENALQQTPCPFDKLFSQEGDGITGRNYITGLLWALETLAWDEKFLVRVCVILGELSIRDPGGIWANRPANSLTMILLPWFPHTTASFDKRKIALQTLQKEVPMVAWKLLLTLLPNQHQISSDTHKPSWRNTIPNGWEKGVTQQEYSDQVLFYSELAVSMACNNIEKLNELIVYLNNIPRPSFDKILKHLSSKDICSKSEDERLPLWTGLIAFTSKHRRFSNVNWVLSSDLISKIESVATKLAPTNPLNLYRRLFSGSDSTLYEENDNREKEREKLEVRRQQAIKNIFEFGGIDAVILFAKSVESPSYVGHSLGVIAKKEIDVYILPTLLKSVNKKLAQFAGGYIWSRQQINGWVWVNELDKTEWSLSQIGEFLSCLPFMEESWNLASKLLGDNESKYWVLINVNPYNTNGTLNVAIDKLIEYGRPHAAISCLYEMFHNKQPLDNSQIINALLIAVSSTEQSHNVDEYHIIELIKYLQCNSNTEPDVMFNIEWTYLTLLNKHHDTLPKLLVSRLESDPEFFCDIIHIISPSKKEDKIEKEYSTQEKAIATNAWILLQRWQTPPGMQNDCVFSGNKFKKWFKKIKEICKETGALEVALSYVGQVLINCPPDSQGLWIDKIVANELNAKDAENMRNGFISAIFNSRDAYTIDPTGKPERELAKKYRQQADDAENASFQRLAISLNTIADEYDFEADKIIEEYKSDN